MAYRHYVLRGTADPIALSDRLSEGLRAVREELGLDLRYGFYRDLADTLGEHVYLEEHDRALVHLVEDDALPARYLQIGADTASTVEAIAACLRGSVDWIGLPELQRIARTEMEHEPSALVRMALGAGPQADSESLALLAAGFDSPSEALRLKAIEAAAMLCWPELLPRVGALGDSDASPEARELARSALEACARTLKSAPR
jgi:hypothetical protein